MRLHCFDGHRPAFEDDGSLAYRPHPVTGHLDLVSSHVCTVTLNGETCHCQLANETAGVVVVAAGGAGEDYEVLQGDVKIHWRPVECGCFVCSRQRQGVEVAAG